MYQTKGGEMKKNLMLILMTAIFCVSVQAQDVPTYSSLRGNDLMERLAEIAASPLPDDLFGGEVNVMLVSNGKLYIGGRFEKADRRVVNNIAMYDGTKWTGLGKGCDGAVFDMVMIGTDLYVTGEFSRVDGINTGGVDANRVARWDGTKWNMLSEQTVDRQIFALAAQGNDLIIGGNFTKVGGSIETKGVARWNGKAWSAVGEKFDKTVLALTCIGSDIYAGGFFTLVGDEPANSIAKWDGTKWMEIGNKGLGGTVNSLANDGKNVYIGGKFTTAGDGSPMNRIAVWDGQSMKQLGDGVDGEVKRVSVVGTDVYVSGFFKSALGGSAAGAAVKETAADSDEATDQKSDKKKKKGKDKQKPAEKTKAAGKSKGPKSVETPGIAKWDGNGWTGYPSLGMYASGTFTSAVFNDAFFVGGSFSVNEKGPSNGTAKLEGGAWVPVVK
jgi:hypothetical protein